MNLSNNTFRKIPKKFTPYVFAFFMAGIMAFFNVHGDRCRE